MFPSLARLRQSYASPGHAPARAIRPAARERRRLVLMPLLVRVEGVA